MDKGLAIIICNYNKEEDVLKCIDSVLKQTFQDVDIYVVDNASTDNSVSKMRGAFGNKITIIENKENMGGSGGFNIGLRTACKKNYQNFMLVDNDIVMEKNAIEALWTFLEKYPEVGLVGSKIMKMYTQNVIQEFGANIDFKQFTYHALYAGMKEEDIPVVQFCDYVPACSLMVRSCVIQKIGILPEENFIYWDDMEWCYRAKLNCYKVAAYAKSKVWHKGGAGSATNTFYNYYWYRNKTKFFINYHQERTEENTKRALLKELFQGIYACYYTKRFNRMKTMVDALEDALDKRMGKANVGRIRDTDVCEDWFLEEIKDYATITLKVNGYYDNTIRILEKIQKFYPDKKVLLLVKDLQEKIYLHENIFKDCIVCEEKFDLNYEIEFDVCQHIFSLKKSDLNTRYVDGWCNVALNEEQIWKCTNFENIFELFYKFYEDRFWI